MRRRASLGLRTPEPGPARLHLAGFRPDSTELVLTVADSPAVTRRVESGQWEMEIELQLASLPRDRDYLPLRLEVATLPPAAEGQVRELGLFLRSICLEPVRR